MKSDTLEKNSIKYRELQNKIRLFHMLQARVEAGPCKQNAVHVTNKNVLHSQRVGKKIKIYCTIIIFSTVFLSFIYILGPLSYTRIFHRNSILQSFKNTKKIEQYI